MPSTMGEQEDFPKHLLEKIFGSIPFPEILKVRQLSTEWNRNFRTVVSMASRTWPTYCPLYILKVMSRSGRRGIGDGSTRYRVGYDCAEGRFRILGQIDWSRERSNPRCETSRSFAGSGGVSRPQSTSNCHQPGDMPEKPCAVL
ncbi:hypothetical protein MPTK1_2g04720 [Marchantia polymorpha subsp. ruderalis]|uniref:F-box domain-containing protein n=1 Tax=Marchantia polymorpha TaxID=3197 RepID=A0A2R6X7U1_MARPO|nr:hypothetical protein MARPO_0031s0127 [Marchantia polymorpha]PTQ42160.1 hypothetical protein MARPO_0031s0127 [Marchantia polymorpha]BBN01110.1 hypothetical protein Mp_2g04720 [Marchantia polymorpha subsp. ruderalis]BBN01111.1 hypothetical protein Mp_2g04720 [Marchantia polymorpha subsp. ruderalis]|eukprot:PTQ42159.1 hypothetical protein MARPO_0031s0127 [Marchantia polymorpha]